MLASVGALKCKIHIVNFKPGKICTDTDVHTEMTRMRTQMPEKLLIPFSIKSKCSFYMYLSQCSVTMKYFNDIKEGYDILHSEINIFVKTSFIAYLKDEEITIPKFNVMRNDYPLSTNQTTTSLKYPESSNNTIVKFQWKSNTEIFS